MLVSNLLEKVVPVKTHPVLGRNQSTKLVYTRLLRGRKYKDFVNSGNRIYDPQDCLTNDDMRDVFHLPK